VYIRNLHIDAYGCRPVKQQKTQALEADHEVRVHWEIYFKCTYNKNQSVSVNKSNLIYAFGE